MCDYAGINTDVLFFAIGLCPGIVVRPGTFEYPGILVCPVI